ncbi:phosphoribosylamine--glycine ligase [Paramuribaculum intestinale]|uniref:phosphoribosylamine--glycine ligase n=1 Tax=Paramuribaculum intestinale TaxID=2094151 RepID=UPI000D1E7498|nr:phosphoribosylamine--glycine ligase [Paramuribaculum intestinale]PWB09921.1 phosphoribosylamine--glycine ligase [Paramuribaculum intestinale]ROS93644.1 phosphoribosylamine--glycine ligase [Muribaculaceae bacterium Isolate-043 (Harlan)]WLT41543.1 phosphoribosylamine--glycine ligase [Paramuribaculum intestinale]
MKVILLGSGGRESALAWKMKQSPLLEKLYIAPGNGGTDAFGTNVAISPTDFEALAEFVDREGIDLIVAGNEDPLVAGLADFFKAKGGPAVCGPCRAGAALEGSKDFAKRFMEANGIPTACYRSFTADTIEEGYRFLEELKAPYVLKADGLAAGKGVLILPTLDEAKESLREMLSGMFGKSSATVVIEEFLSGIECSVFVLTDGHGGYRVLPVAKDYKRIGEGDTGLNTGGMGAVSPVPFADDTFMEKVRTRIILPTLDGLKREGIDYRGFIFLGLISVEGEPMVIEYNVRMGDPETEAVMLRVDSDLLQLMNAAAHGDLGDLELKENPQTAVTVMMVSGGYPGSYPKGKEITGLDTVSDSIAFHAGTSRGDDGRLVTSGGRVISVSSLGSDIAEALDRSYRSIAGIDFEGKYSRRDIGRDLMKLQGIEK